MAILTLTTDFGTEDGNVGVMKGVILGIAPEVQIVDLSHQIAPQNIHQAAFVLARQIFYFPPETVHVVVVDPGVGTDRRPIAARVGNQLLVGPDNGVFTPLYLRAEQVGWPVEVVHTNRSQFWREPISNVFHGRDIFSPVGAHLALKAPLEEIGEWIEDPVRIEWASPAWDGDAVRGEVTYIDHFGNLFTNITAEDLAGREVRTVQLGEIEIEGLARTFGDRQPGEVIALFSSTDEVLIAQVNGSAARQTGAQVDSGITVFTRRSTI